ncbi:MAG TPA: 8-oxo-dGTP diphosphatase [Candidatus Sumerlaeota bacterium]|nr:8-oxo-dGTP diphosphatase [Candidatus Sumerlaeota bacterium]
MIPATLCYVRDRGRTLMLHRIKKLQDIHEGKWNGLGGKFEPGESPEECVIREVCEESGLFITQPRLKGYIVFPRFDGANDWHVFIFTAEHFTGELLDSPEGRLEWIDDERLFDLNLWEGDRIFLPWVLGQAPFFTAKFLYDRGSLQSHSVIFYSP